TCLGNFCAASPDFVREEGCGCGCTKSDLEIWEACTLKGFGDLLWHKFWRSGQLLADEPGLCGGDVAGSGEARGKGCGGHRRWRVGEHKKRTALRRFFSIVVMLHSNNFSTKLTKFFLRRFSVTSRKSF
ncbi:MAG: hypothetical protein K6G13_05935, partial [Agathobacter sp.]|uniref:hypothetical protein n=1 Tax=Agathobacter sp. TaxID=2021311 RepID=UPI002587F081